MTNAFKRLRNAVSDRAADVALRSAGGERLFIRGASLLVRFPLLYGVARRGMQTLSVRMRDRSDRLRRLRVGPVDFLIDVTDDVLREMYFAHVPCEPVTTAWMLDHVRRGDIVVDAGANVGYYSLLAARLVGTGGRVVAFEPNPAVGARLAAHVRANAVESIVTISATALSDVNARAVPLFVPPQAAESGLASLTFTPALAARCAASIQVSCQQLDAWLEETPLARIDLMKIDVEGAESQVIDGMRRTLDATRPRHIICETTWEGPAHRALVDAGYRAHPLDWFDREAGMANVLFA